MSAAFSATFSDQHAGDIMHNVGDIGIVRNASHICHDSWMEHLDEILKKNKNLDGNSLGI
jgi:hypothetical protein